MAKNSPLVADAVVDLEKGTVTVKEVEKEEELAIVDPWKAKLVSLVVDAVLMVYVLVFAGLMAYSVKHSKDWGEVFRCFLIMLPFMLWNFCLIPQLKKLAVKVLAKKKRSSGSGSGSGDLSTKLLASEK